MSNMRRVSDVNKSLIADALAPCVTKSSVPMTLKIKYIYIYTYFPTVHRNYVIHPPLCE